MKSYPLNIFILSVCLCLPLTACKDDSVSSLSPSENMGDTEYIGKAVGNFTAEEWYPGGSLGTTDNVTAGCYEDETKAVEEQGLVKEFNLGESFFERNYNTNTPPFNGLGPASVRSSCIDCHPGYGHGKRQDDYHANTYGNGYLLVVYHPDVPGSNDGAYISEVTGMPQTQATSPFLPPIDENQINISWHTVTAMESGLPLQFPDGEKYELIYPEVTIPQTAFNTTPQPSDFEVRLESTIGIIGTLLVCTVVYIFVALVLTGIVPWNMININAPIAHAIQMTGQSWFAGLISLGALTGLTSVLLVMQLAATRILFSMARDNFFPTILKKVHPVYKTPHIITWIVGIAMMIGCLFLDLNLAAQLCIFSVFTSFIVVCISVLILRKTDPDRERPFKVPFSPLFPSLGILLCGGLMCVAICSMGKNALLFPLWLIIGLAIYAGYGYKRNRRIEKIEEKREQNKAARERAAAKNM